MALRRPGHDLSRRLPRGVAEPARRLGGLSRHRSALTSWASWATRPGTPRAIAYDADLWAECLRVLKPGGHLLAFGGTRTWHRLAVAVEDAGFEVRDSIAWLYGSGFPKSLDVSKAIDKAPGRLGRHRRRGPWLESRRQESGVTRRQVEEHFGTQNIGQALFTVTPGSTPRVADWDQWTTQGAPRHLGMKWTRDWRPDAARWSGWGGHGTQARL
jgi:hypothetical protein